MFSDKVWAMIHNRFKDSQDRRKWTDDMSAADWWIANDMGNPYAENVEIVSPYQMPSGMMGFFERLHHAYIPPKASGIIRTRKDGMGSGYFRSIIP